MAESITVRGMRARAKRFKDCQTFEQLAVLLRTPPMKLLGLAVEPPYDEFYIPKKSGGRRLIENPVPILKKVQRRLNDYLQAVYYFHRTEAAYGFLMNPKDDPMPRHILANASQHVGCSWMLNVDMQDFFHLVSQARVAQLFEAPMLDFNEEMSKTLAALCCYNGRLPMGAPTSPILSNIAAMPLDMDLRYYAEQQGWRYTRYADDMTFSGQTPITENHIAKIKQWVELYDFKLNPDKVKLFSPERKDKEVTGLRIGAKEVALPPSYLLTLAEAIGQLSKIVDAKHCMPSGRLQHTPWLMELEQKVKGKLEFARQILGEEDDQYWELETAYLQALEPPEQYGPIVWLDFGYSLFK